MIRTPVFINLFLAIMLYPLLLFASDPAERVLNSSLLYYSDNRGFDTLGIVIGSNRLPAGFSIWGFTDLHGAMEEDEHSNAQNSFSEYRLSWSSFPKDSLKPLGLQLEFDDLTPGDGNILRLGLTWKQAAPFGGALTWRLFPLESDGDGGQASLLMRLPLGKRFSISGFADYNWSSDTEDQWVLEPQLNLLLTQRWYVMLEYRYNGFQASNPTIDGSGIALGLRLNL